MLWKWILCLSFVIVVTSEEVELTNGIKNIANEILRKFNEQNEHKLAEVANALKDTPRAQEAIINDYVDEFLKELNAFIIIQGLDPIIEMPEIKEEFVWKVGFIKYKGIMHLTDGMLQGLGTMDRYGNVILTYEYPNVQIRMDLGYNVLMFDYKYKAKFMGLGPRGNVYGKTVNCRFTIDMDINMITLMAKLHKFNLNTVGKISLKFRGNVLTDWMTNIFVSVTIPFVKPILNIVIQNFVRGGLQTGISSYNNFMCTLLDHCELSISLKFSGNSLTDWMVNLFTTFTKPMLTPALKKKLSEYLHETFEELVEEHNKAALG